MNFVKKIFLDRVDEKTHFQFIKFGKGNYNGKFLLNLWKTNKFKVKTSFEFANDLTLFCSELGDCKVSGIVLSKENITDILSKNNIQCDSKAKKGGAYYETNIPAQELKKDQLIELEKETYSTLLDIEGDGFKLKVKKKLPRPGKSEKKVDGGFCKLELDERYGPKIMGDFFWDMPKAKKININHGLIINSIVFPENEKDYSKLREIAKRKGKIIRKAVVDEKEIISEKDLLV